MSQEEKVAPAVEESEPKPQKKSSKKINWKLVGIISAIAFVVLAAAGVGGYFLWANKADEASSSTTTETEEEEVKQITWQEPEKVKTPSIYLSDAPNEMASSTAAEKEASTSFYKVGTVNTGKYEGGTVYSADLVPAGPSLSDLYARFIKHDGTYYLLEKYSSEIDDNDGLNPAKYEVDSSYEIADLDVPNTITDGDNEETFVRDLSSFALFSDDNLVKAFSDDSVGQVYTTKKQADSVTENTTALDFNGFYAKAADGTAVVYELQVNFMKKDTVPEVTFTGGSSNYSDYNYTDRTGCGSFNYLSVPSSVSSSDMEKVGENKWGDPVYGLKNDNHTILKKYYEGYESSLAEGTTAYTYSEFLKDHPIFFWETPYGQLVKFENKTYELMAECGKPVIYLYPEESTKVSVKVTPRKGMTYSDPVYNGLWEVIADPNGVLTEISSGKTYPYLFWEGNGGIYRTPEKGFVVTRAGVPNLIDEKLGLYGLNEQEIADFKEFWVPLMQEKPYYFVTFLGNRDMNILAPLEVEPKPDTVIRVLMDFTPLDEPIEVEGYNIVTPERNGFTLVEWGGVLRGELK